MGNKNHNNSVLGRGIKIAFHIIRGDNISPPENNFLYEKFPWMYIKAWSERDESGGKNLETPQDEKKELMKFIDSGVLNMSREVMMKALGVSV